LTSPLRRVKDPLVFESGFHRLTFFFGLASVAVWTYVFNEWWGGEWWGLLLAVAAAIPVGIVFSILPARNVEAATPRERTPFSPRALSLWIVHVH